MVLSTDRENLTDVLAMTGASAALHLSDIPWAGPFAGVRVGRVNGEFIVNPTVAQRDVSELDLIVGGQPRRHRHGRGWRAAGGRGRDRRCADVRAQGGAAAHRPAGEAARGGGQDQARVHAADRRSGARGARVGIREGKDRGRHGHSREARALRRPRQGRGRDARSAQGRVPGARRRDQGSLRQGQEEEPARAGADHRPPHRRPRHRRDSPDHLRGQPAATHARLGAVHARRNPVAGERHARHQAGRAAHRRPRRGIREDLHASLQLPAVLDRRDQAAARRQPPRNRPRPPGRARLESRAARREDLPVHHSRGVGNSRVER